MVGESTILTHFATTTSDVDVVRVVVVGALALAVVCLLAGSVKKRKPGHVGWPFALIAIITIASSALLIGTTVDNFAQSQGGGLERRAFTVEYWTCGVELDIVNPDTPFRYSIGEGPYYEFDDKVARFQGVVSNTDPEPTLADFQRAISGLATSDEMRLPVTDDVVESREDGDLTDPSGRSRIDKFVQFDASINATTVNVASGDTCGDQEAEVQYFVFRLAADGKTYTQQKVTFPSLITFQQASSINDCVIVEFDTPRQTTDRLCVDYGLRDSARCQDFRLNQSTSGACDLRQKTVRESEGS